MSRPNYAARARYAATELALIAFDAFEFPARVLACKLIGHGSLEAHRMADGSVSMVCRRCDYAVKA